MKKWWPTLLWLAAAAWMGWWLTSNPLPDGYQNEYLHVGNAFDLWGALATWDVWHLRWYMYRVAPWPWGLHAPAAPLFALLGPSHGALVATNLLHLAVLLWATSRLGRVFSAPLAPLLVVLAPGVFGSLVRYEPNLAAIAWSAAALACAVSSRGLRDRGMVIGWGCSLGIGLMMDRLTVGFFALPVVLSSMFPGARIDLPGWLAAGIGLTLYMGCFATEIFRGGIISIDKGQWQAARAIGMTYGEMMWHVILPQAIRRMIARDIKYLTVRRAVQDRYNARLRRRMKHTVWHSGCSSWYLGEDGVNHALYPGLAIEYTRSVRRFRPDEYEVVPVEREDSVPVASGAGAPPRPDTAAAGRSGNGSGVSPAGQDRGLSPPNA